MWEEVIHVLPPTIDLLPTLGASIRFHTRTIPAGTFCRFPNYFSVLLTSCLAHRDACSKMHHLMLITDPRFSYKVQFSCFTLHSDEHSKLKSKRQVTFSNDYVSYLSGYVTMYAALVGPATFMWFFAALAYQFYCWRTLGAFSSMRSLVNVLSQLVQIQIGSFPSLAVTLHRLVAHLSPFFLLASIVTRLLPYLKLQTVREEGSVLSWTFTTDREEAFPAHLMIIVPFLSCIVVLGLSYAQAISLTCSTPILYAFLRLVKFEIADYRNHSGARSATFAQ